MGISTRSYKTGLMGQTGLMGTSTRSYKTVKSVKMSFDERCPYFNEACQTGLMGISTRSYKTGLNILFEYFHIKTGLMGGNTILGKGFKHSIVWHLKEIKEIKRPKNLIIFVYIHLSKQIVYVVYFDQLWGACAP